MTQEIHFQLNGRCIAAQVWGNPDGCPVLALHGWLDNSASFFRLAPLLRDLNIVALDMAGHGQSDHRQSSASYNILDDIQDIFSIADQLQWPRFSLLGHSRGAIISALAAGTFPERIDRLWLIEGIFPEPVAPKAAPEQLANALKTLQHLETRPLKTFVNPAAAGRARQRGMFPLSEQAAQVLAERGIRAVEGGFQWSTDQKLLAPSAFKLSKEQIVAFMDRIKAQTDLILGDKGVVALFPHLLNDVKKFPTIRIHSFVGGHHLHMEQAAGDIASLLQTLAGTDQPQP